MPSPVGSRRLACDHARLSNWIIMRLLPILVIMAASALACSDNGTAQTSPIVPSTGTRDIPPTLRSGEATIAALSARSTARALNPRPTPTPDYWNRGDLPWGEIVSLWVYADAPENSETCAELLGEMIPDGALDEGAGKVVECTLEGISKHRLALRSDANGVIHLVGVQLLLLFTEDLPQGGPPTECRDVTDYMLPESANPEAIQDGGRCRQRCSLRLHAASAGTGAITGPSRLGQGRTTVGTTRLAPGRALLAAHPLPRRTQGHQPRPAQRDLPPAIAVSFG